MGKALLAALLFLNVGVPVNALWPFAVLALALLVLVSAQVRPGSRRLWLIGGIFLAGQLAKLLLAPPQAMAQRRSGAASCCRPTR